MNRALVVEKKDFTFEIKFKVPEAIGSQVLEWARKHLVPDAHLDLARGDSYTINSLYLDTAALDVYHRVGSYGRSKYRLRRYGAEQAVYLERKMKTRGLVGKLRTRVAAEEISRLEQNHNPSDWAGYWFHRRLQVRRLLPRCQIAYERVARVGQSSEGPVRLTLDREIQANPATTWGIAEPSNWTPLLAEQCILELKYRATLPALFRSLVQEFALEPQPVSKYRLSVAAFGWAPETVGAAPASGNGHVSHSDLPPLVPGPVNGG